MEEGKKNSASIFSIMGILVIGIVIGGTLVWLKTTGGNLVKEKNEEIVAKIETPSKIVTLEEAVQKSPEDPTLWLELANAYFDAGESRKALLSYEMVINLKLITPEILIDYGTSLRKEGRMQESLQQYNKALLLAPKHGVALYNKGLLLYYDLGKKQDAFATWNVLIKELPNAKTPDGERLEDFVLRLKEPFMAPTLQ